MSVEELQAKYKEVFGSDPVGPHKNKAEWLEKKIAESSIVDVVEPQKAPKKTAEAKMGFQIDRNVKVGGKIYEADSWVDEDDENASVLKNFAK